MSYYVKERGNISRLYLDETTKSFAKVTSTSQSSILNTGGWRKVWPFGAHTFYTVSTIGYVNEKHIQALQDFITKKRAEYIDVKHTILYKGRVRLDFTLYDDSGLSEHLCVAEYDNSSFNYQLNTVPAQNKYLLDEFTDLMISLHSNWTSLYENYGIKIVLKRYLRKSK